MKNIFLIFGIFLFLGNCEQKKEDINPLILGKWALSELFYGYKNFWEPALETSNQMEFLANGEVRISPEGNSTFKAKYKLNGNELTIIYPFGGPVIYQIRELKATSMIFENKDIDATNKYKYLKIN